MMVIVAYLYLSMKIPNHVCRHACTYIVHVLYSWLQARASLEVCCCCCLDLRMSSIISLLSSQVRSFVCHTLSS